MTWNTASAKSETSCSRISLLTPVISRHGPLWFRKSRSSCTLRHKWTRQDLERLIEPPASAGLHQGQRHPSLRSMRALDSTDTACLRRGATRRGAGNAHVLFVSRRVPRRHLAAPVRACLTHLALPRFVGVPPAGAPCLAVLDSTSGLRPAALYGALWRRAEGAGTHTRAPDVDVAHAWAVVRRPEKYGRRARTSQTVSSVAVELQALYK